MSETHIVHNIDDFNIQGYLSFYNNSSLTKFDGCMVYVKQQLFLSYSTVVVNDLKCAQVSLCKNGVLFDILGTYRSPSTDVVDFLNNLKTILEDNTKDSKKNYVWVGDINIDLLDTRSEVTGDYITLLHRYGFFSVINKVTRQQGNSATCIDHYFVKCKNELFNKINSVVLTRDISDHFPILLVIELDVAQVNVKNDQTFHKINHNLLTQVLSEAQWEDVASESDADVCTEIFINQIQKCIKKCTTIVKVSNKKTIKKSWITSGLLVSIRKRDKLKKYCTMNPNYFNALNKYKDHRKELSKLIKKSKYDYFKAKIKNSTNDSKKLWNVIREATNDVQVRSDIKCLLNEKNVEITDKHLIAHEFNSNFNNVGKNLAKKLKFHIMCSIFIKEIMCALSLFI